MKPGNISWHELLTDDVEGAKAFYSNTFGWTFEEVGESTEYWGFHDGVRVSGGIMERPEGTPVHSIWTIYVTVSDINQTVAAARSLGGKIPLEPMEVEDVGTIAVIEDPQGAFIHVIEYLEPSKLPDEETDPGIDADPPAYPQDGQFCWYTLMTPNASKAKTFYESLFDWEIQDAPRGGGNEAFTVTNDGFPIAGIMAADPNNEEVPPSWGVAIATDDIDGKIAAIKKNGGSVHMGPLPAGSIGKNAVVQDAAGTYFSVFEADMEGMAKMMENF